MNVLIACEFSGAVRDAFRARGHDAWSCDLLAPDVGESGLGHIYHIRGDVRRVLDGRIPPGMVADSIYRDTPIYRKWDLMIAHPDCTYLSSSGLHWNKRGRMVDGVPRAEMTERALAFVRELMDAPIPRIAIENPVGCIATRIRPADQYIQPYNFGADASKKTGLWLTNLPLIKDGEYIAPRIVCALCKACERGEAARDMAAYGCPRCGAEAGSMRPRWANQTDSGQNKLTPSDDRWAARAVTYPGIAAAFAEQWGSSGW